MTPGPGTFLAPFLDAVVHLTQTYVPYNHAGAQYYIELPGSMYSIVCT